MGGMRGSCQVQPTPHRAGRQRPCHHGGEGGRGRPSGRSGSCTNDRTSGGFEDLPSIRSPPSTRFGRTSMRVTLRPPVWPGSNPICRAAKVSAWPPTMCASICRPSGCSPNTCRRSPSCAVHCPGAPVWSIAGNSNRCWIGDRDITGSRWRKRASGRDSRARRPPASRPLPPTGRLVRGRAALCDRAACVVARGRHPIDKTRLLYMFRSSGCLRCAYLVPRRRTYSVAFRWPK